MLKQSNSLLKISYFYDRFVFYLTKKTEKIFDKSVFLAHAGIDKLPTVLYNIDNQSISFKNAHRAYV